MYFGIFPHLNHVAAIVCFILFIILTPSHSDAFFPGEAHSWAGPSLSTLKTDSAPAQLGIALQTGLQLSLSDFWNVTTGVESSYIFANKDHNQDQFFIHNAFIGVRYSYDIVRFVPYGGLSMTAYINAPHSSRLVTPGAKLSIGCHWRVNRHWSWGVQVETHALFSKLSTLPAYSTFGLYGIYHFRI